MGPGYDPQMASNGAAHPHHPDHHPSDHWLRLRGPVPPWLLILCLAAGGSGYTVGRRDPPRRVDRRAPPPSPRAECNGCQPPCTRTQTCKGCTCMDVATAVRQLDQELQQLRAACEDSLSGAELR